MNLTSRARCTCWYFLLRLCLGMLARWPIRFPIKLSITAEHFCNEPVRPAHTLRVLYAWLCKEDHGQCMPSGRLADLDFAQGLHKAMVSPVCLSYCLPALSNVDFEMAGLFVKHDGGPRAVQRFNTLNNEQIGGVLIGRPSHINMSCETKQSRGQPALTNPFRSPFPAFNKILLGRTQRDAQKTFGPTAGHVVQSRPQLRPTAVGASSAQSLGRGELEWVAWPHIC